MTTHPNRGWRARWTVAVAAKEARHGPTGLVVRFVRRGEGWDGHGANLDAVYASLTRSTAPEHLASTLARLLREAGEIFVEKNNS